jgi:hypothetical protein
VEKTGGVEQTGRVEKTGGVEQTGRVEKTGGVEQIGERGEAGNGICGLMAAKRTTLVPGRETESIMGV